MGDPNQFYGYTLTPGSPPMYYAQHVTQHGPGSLGTPHYPNYSPSGSVRSPYGGAGGGGGGGHVRRTTPKGNQQPNNTHNNNADIILTPTRPVLKALARACRCPPWSVGRAPTQASSLNDELQCFVGFLSHTPQETAQLHKLFDTIRQKADGVWSGAVVSPVNAYALGVHIPSSVVELAVISSTDEADKLKEFTTALNNAGFSSEIVPNTRGTTSLRIVEAVGGERFLVHTGRTADDIVKSTQHLQSAVTAAPAVRGAIATVDTVLRQSKYSEDGGATGGFSTEVVAVMMLSLLPKYSDVPTGDRLTMDFFITFGWHFDTTLHSVQTNHVAGTEGKQWPDKIHTQHQLEVRDPVNADRNLSATVNKFPQVRSLFQYCFMQLNQWVTTSQESRAQSPLSTIIGGEAFWGRVLFLALGGVEPYASVVNEKKQVMRL
eukprot:PhM_4_TR2139/c4_g1_i1/m.54109/K03514/PAPD5_7, TRF4; non-canonical poly(A) RNA polymerase PAPD5/7